MRTPHPFSSFSSVCLISSSLKLCQTIKWKTATFNALKDNLILFLHFYRNRPRFSCYNGAKVVLPEQQIPILDSLTKIVEHLLAMPKLFFFFFKSTAIILHHVEKFTFKSDRAPNSFFSLSFVQQQQFACREWKIFLNLC